MMEWQFNDPKNVAVFTTRYVIRDKKPIIYVSHDEDDGAWQFHSDDDADADDAMIVSLEEMVLIDFSITELHNLPEGWYACREDEKTEWIRNKKD